MNLPKLHLPTAQSGLSTLFLLALGAGPLSAASINIPDSGFENTVLVDGDSALQFTAGLPVGGWTAAGGVGFGAGVFNPTVAEFSGLAPEGENVGVLISFNSAWLIQTLPTVYVSGTTYTLTALVGDADHTDLKNFSIGLYDAGSIVSTLGTTPIPADDGFSLVTATLTAGPALDGKPIEIWLGSGASLLTDDPDGTSGQVFFDDVQLTAVPEPSSVLLLGIALPLLLRRKKNG